MNRIFLDATQMVASGRLAEATAAIQRVLGGHGAVAAPDVAEPEGAGQFLARRFSNAAGTRPYRLYVPAGHNAARPAPLVVMLHGCTQSPEDFARGTRMNEAAEARGFLVAYPGQTNAANAQKCWNWFNVGDQGRDAGEPSLIAGLTREVVRQYGVDPRRIYIAGLSAGGAAASIMGGAYPELYAAVGVHSGLACGAARDMPRAFAAMRNGAAGSTFGRAIPTIIFHGDQDSTVNQRNGDAVATQAAAGARLTERVESGRDSSGHAYRRIVRSDAAGRPMIEQWLVHGAGHAWSGGSEAGSYTDPRGPDATAAMVRFFRQHAQLDAPARL